MKEYYRKVLECAVGKESMAFLFTVTCNDTESCKQKNKNVYRFHLQDAFQRVQMDMRAKDGFAIFVMDQLNSETINQVKAACNEFAKKGDYVEYKHLYQGVLIENSRYSPGIQLADYAAGIMNSYLKRRFISSDNYAYANDLYELYLRPRLRQSDDGAIAGYGVVEIPKQSRFRNQIIALFD